MKPFLSIFRALLPSLTGRVRVGLFLLAMTILVSCKPSLPSGIISEGDMEDILYDYHIAVSLNNIEDSKYNEQRLYNDILDKYGYTQAEFDTSMVYYTRHYRFLNAIYKNIENRMMEQTVAMGGNVQDLNSMGEGFSSADTTNVWHDASSVILVPYAPYDVKSFEIKVDTAYHQGDRLILSFDTDFLIQDGRRDVVAMLAVKFKNDSITSSTQHFSAPMHATLTVDDGDRLGIKSVIGFLTFSSDTYSTQTTTKVALVRNIKLIRMHTADPKALAEERARADSLRNDSLNRLSNGIQKAPLDSASGTNLDTLGRESIILPKERQTRP